MDKLKNFIYNTSDILIAVLIILVSITVISAKTTNILNYDKFSAQAEAHNQKNDNFGLAVPVGEQDKPQTDANSGGQTPGKQPEANNPEMYSVYINQGESIQSIADKFVSLGMFKSREEFISLAEEMQATTSMKYGNFIIPANAKKKEVISRLVIAP